MQSLADVAEKEAERRSQIENQGVQEKVIMGDGESLAPNGNLTVSTPSGAKFQNAEAPAKDQKKMTSIRSYRAALQKLDRAIRDNEMRMDSLRARMQAEKKRISKNSLPSSAQSRLQEQIDQLQTKVEQARKDRAGIYQSGRKDGYLPGELDGKGIVP
jgi:predicted RNase H-like nuclease (RuvC/YqgF family)